MSCRPWIACLAIISALSAAPADASITVSIGSTSISAGGTGIVDIYASNTEPGSAAILNEFGITLQITSAGSTHLEFDATTQPASYLTDPGANYIFGTTGSDRQAAPDGGIGISTTGYPNDTIFISDFILDSSTVTLIQGDAPVLLARVLLTAAPPDGGDPNPGDSFTIGLVPSSGSGSFGDSTFFDIFDANNGPGDPVAFDSTPGTVRITAAVPEPSSIAMGLIGLLTIGGVRGLRRHTGRGR